MKEYSGIGRHQTPESALLEMSSLLTRAPFIVFSDVVRKKHKGAKRNTSNAYNTYLYIRKHNLGTISKSDVLKNPNSGNMLQTYLWSVNRRRLKVWAAKERTIRTAIAAAQQTTVAATVTREAIANGCRLIVTYAKQHHTTV